MAFAQSHTIMDLDSAQTATNKTLTSPTITNPTITGTISGSGTLTNPTITGTISGSPTISSPTITNATMTGATLNGGTVSGATIPGGTISGGSISGTPIDNSVIGGTTPAAGNFTTASFSGALSSTKSCPTGYTRVLAEWCYRTTAISFGEIITTSCTTLPIGTDYGIPATAKIWQPLLTLVIQGGGTAGQASEKVQFYSDSGCTTVLGGDGISQGAFYEAYLPAVNGAAFSSYQYPKLYINGATTIYAKVITTVLPSAAFWTVEIIDSPMFAD